MEIDPTYIAEQRDRIATDTADALYRIGMEAGLLPPDCLEVVPGSDTANAILCWLALNDDAINVAQSEISSGRSPIGVT